MATVDPKSVIGGLTADQRESLLARSDAAGLRHLLCHLGALGIATGFIVFDIARPPAMVLQGVLLVFLFTPLHETVHRTPFRSRWLNDSVGRFCGVVVFIGPTWFRHFHLAHHRYTNQSDLDPELASPRPATRWQYVLYLSGVPDLVGRIWLIVRNALTTNEDVFVPERAKAAVRREAQLQLVLYVALIGGSVVGGSSAVLFVWVLPMLIGGPLLRAYLLAEHGDCSESASIFENTRTVFTTPLVRALAWNMPYHAEHHAFPAVPFHKLPRFHEHTRPNLAVTERGYVRFNLAYVSSLGAAVRAVGRRS